MKEKVESCALRAWGADGDAGRLYKRKMCAYEESLPISRYPLSANKLLVQFAFS